MVRGKKERRPPKWPQLGDVVDYHSLIGGPVTHPNLTVRGGPEWVGMRWCVWVTGVVGCVAIEALSKPTMNAAYIGEGPTTRYVGPGPASGTVVADGKPPGTETVKRPAGCKCHWEEGDSDCPVHRKPGAEFSGRIGPNTFEVDASGNVTIEEIIVVPSGRAPARVHLDCADLDAILNVLRIAKEVGDD